MLKGFDNHFTAKFKNVTEGFTVDEDIPGLNNKSNNPTITNDTEIQHKLEKMKFNNNNTKMAMNNNTKMAMNNNTKMAMNNNTKMAMNNTSKIHLDILKNMSESHKSLISTQEKQNEERAIKLSGDNKRRDTLNNKYIRNEKLNTKQMNNSDKHMDNIDNKLDNVYEEHEHYHNSELFENVLEEHNDNELVLDEDIIEEEDVIEAFSNQMVKSSIKEGFMGSKIINNHNNKTVLLTILITFLSYIMCHQTSKHFVKSNIKSLDKLLNLDNMLNNNITIINLLLFGITVFILLQIL